MPGGRPTKYKKELCDTVIACGKDGMGKLEMCAELNIHYTTFELWQEKHSEFSEAVKEGLRQSQAWWERKGREKTFDSKDFNATSYIFNMKNRFPSDWRDKQEVESRLDVTDPVAELFKSIAKSGNRVGDK